MEALGFDFGKLENLPQEEYDKMIDAIKESQIYELKKIPENARYRMVLEGLYKMLEEMRDDIKNKDESEITKDYVLGYLELILSGKEMVLI